MKEDILNDHKEIRKNNEIGKVVVPKPGYIEFNKYFHELRLPYAIFADFKSVLQLIDENAGKNTTRYRNHIPSSFGIYVVSAYNNTKVPLYVYRRKNTAKFFREKIMNIGKEIHKLLRVNKEMIPLNEKEREIHDNAHKCYIRLKPFEENEVYNHEVYNHDHWTRKYRGPAYNSCNVNYHASRFIPVYLHLSYPDMTVIYLQKKT